ncbi:pyruvate dehydrogenase complex dihydrolipoamide acetyltransferase component (E2) [Tieghemiomyces parasiticus]|uniref:Acetyltransferase component of pyruvate dehydrogenase complex n=1 Tax=Tieghemiomyces parasiticus TaxID=78921 RepID=A0A9W8A3H2_9FUNG|nr:pyruvate dehydrogenase complex dihydrolipoamide acetyltransferase component (E2) [Tieghemiomyces parasiticus]
MLLQRFSTAATLGCGTRSGAILALRLARRGLTQISSLNVTRAPTTLSKTATLNLRAAALAMTLPGLSTHARLYSSKSYPPHTVIDMPALSPTMTAGNVGAWQKEVGDEIVPGDVLVEIETDKAQMDFECQEEGYLAKILCDSGSKDVAVGHPIAILVENKADADKFADFQPESAGEGAAKAAEPESPKEEASKPEPKKEESKPEPTKQEKQTESQRDTAPASGNGSGRIFASPLAKTIAREKNLNLADVQGTGPHGRIVKADVEKFISEGGAAKKSAAPTKATPAPAAAPVPSAGTAYTDIPTSNMRRVIASRLVESKQQLPHYYVTVEVNMDKINKLRTALNEAGKGEYKLSVNDFIIKASALTLLKVPEVNSSWQKDFIRQYHNADISVATATPSGLITPIIRSAEAKGLAGISNTMKELAARARENGLKPEEYQGGSFTISNLGMFGVDSFTAIINPPQSCILAVGATTEKVVPDASAPGGFKVAAVMKVTLSADHRVVDGAVSAQWLKAWKELMENPLKLLL